MIRVPQVRVVDEEGNQMGVLSTADALRLAQERGYDLVEVAPMASPPVTRLLDYGQFKYEQARREKEARRHQRSVDFKEIRLKVKIGKGDFDTERQPLLEGKQMSLVMASTHKPKVQPAPEDKRQQPTNGAAAPESDGATTAAAATEAAEVPAAPKQPEPEAPAQTDGAVSPESTPAPSRTKAPVAEAAKPAGA
jgi:hypothetical protein